MEEQKREVENKVMQENQLQSASIMSNHSNHSSPAKKEIRNELSSLNKNCKL